MWHGIKACKVITHDVRYTAVMYYLLCDTCCPYVFDDLTMTGVGGLTALGNN